MSFIMGILILSFIFTSVGIIPFINLLYKLKFQRKNQHTKDAFGVATPIFDKFHRIKTGVPVGGGFLVIFIVSVLFALLFPLLSLFGIHITVVYPLKSELNVIFFTFLSFGLLGLYDDIKKFFGFEKQGFFGLRMWHKLLLQIILATIIACMLYFGLGISILNIPSFGYIHLGWVFVPFAIFTIVGFANAVNITDGLDGLASGVLMICLFGLWFLSASILDTPLSMFIALWIGALIAFLYFNVFPARVMMGDVGALSFGATLAVVGLLLGKVFALGIIGGIFIVEILTSFIQLFSKRVFKRKVFTVAPLHLWFQNKGWPEPKIVQRAWIAGIILTLFGVWLAMI